MYLSNEKNNKTSLHPDFVMFAIFRGIVTMNKTNVLCCVDATMLKWLAYIGLEIQMSPIRSPGSEVDIMGKFIQSPKLCSSNSKNGYTTVNR